MPFEGPPEFEESEERERLLDEYLKIRNWQMHSTRSLLDKETWQEAKDILGDASEDKESLNTFQIMDALAERRMELSKELGKDAAKIDDELRAQVEEKIS